MHCNIIIAQNNAYGNYNPNIDRMNDLYRSNDNSDFGKIMTNDDLLDQVDDEVDETFRGMINR